MKSLYKEAAFDSAAGNRGPRDTARAIVFNESSKILLMERERMHRTTGERLHYFSIPGGGIEKGESPELTAIREIKEEMSVDIALIGLAATIKNQQGIHYYYKAQGEGDPHLDPESDEFKKYSSSTNVFKPGWFDLDKLDESMLHPVYRPIFPYLGRLANGEMPKEPWQIIDHGL